MRYIPLLSSPICRQDNRHREESGRYQVRAGKGQLEHLNPESIFKLCLCFLHQAALCNRFLPPHLPCFAPFSQRQDLVAGVVPRLIFYVSAPLQTHISHHLVRFLSHASLAFLGLTSTLLYQTHLSLFSNKHRLDFPSYVLFLHNT